MQQAGVPESQMAGHNRAKWRVGRALKFLRRRKDSNFSFKRHDVVRSLRDNPFGLGIYVRSDRTGIEDIVWPEEVDLT